MMCVDLARELFDYRDGNLYWRRRMNKKHSIDKPAGTVDQRGYRIITLNGKKYGAHRLVWLWHGNELKELPWVLDHINGDTLDNRIENLRAADVARNGQNSKLKADNKSGVRGVSWCNTFNKWTVQLYANNKKTTARFKTFEEAANFATEKRKEIHGEFYSERVA